MFFKCHLSLKRTQINIQPFPIRLESLSKEENLQEFLVLTCKNHKTALLTSSLNVLQNRFSFYIRKWIFYALDLIEVSRIVCVPYILENNSTPHNVGFRCHGGTIVNE